MASAAVRAGLDDPPGQLDPVRVPEHRLTAPQVELARRVIQSGSDGS